MSTDTLVERSHRMLSLDVAKSRNVLSLQNWVSGNTCSAREETAYLNHGADLISLAPPEDGAMARLQGWVEDGLIMFRKRFRMV